MERPTGADTKTNRAASAKREPSLSAAASAGWGPAAYRWRRNRIVALVKQNPEITQLEIARTLGISKSVVCSDVAFLRNAGALPIRDAMKQEIVAAIRDNPTATKTELAKRFGCSPRVVENVRRRMRSRGELAPCDPHEEPFNALEDQRVLREPWYVAEVCGRGFPGMKLPQEYWARYLTLYEARRQRSDAGPQYAGAQRLGSRYAGRDRLETETAHAADSRSRLVGRDS